MSASVFDAASPWIISKRDDLVFFLGSAALGYLLLLVAFAANGLPAVVFFQVTFLIDSPHIYSTATRVLLDSEERQRQRLYFLAFIPLWIGAVLVGYYGGFERFFLLLMVWGQLHVAKQHFGFLAIYKRRASERTGFLLDKRIVVSLLYAPFVCYLVTWITGRNVVLPCAFVAGAVAAGYVYKQLRDSQSRALRPKISLIVILVPLHWLAWGFAAMSTKDFSRVLAAAAITTAGHGIQYLRLMWLHNRNRYSARKGLLGIISRHPARFFMAALVLSAPQYLGNITGRSFMGCIGVAVLMMHYLLDGRIWRLRGDPELTRALKL